MNLRGLILLLFAASPVFGQWTVGSRGFNSSPAAAVPTFSITAGSYSTPQLVSLSDITPSSTIYYTVDGSTPTTSSAVYLGVPIYVYTSQTLKAIAAATGLPNSAVGSASYTVAQQLTRFSLSRNYATQTTVPAPRDDRPAPYSGVRISDIEASNGTYNWTIYDGWAAAAASGGWNLSFTYQSRPAWMSGQPALTEGPSSDWNTATACGTIGGMVLGTTTDCMWKSFVIHHMMHVTGLSTVPSAPVSCPQLNAVEMGNEVDTYSGGSSMVGWSASQTSFVATAVDGAAIIHQWCSVNSTKVLLGSLSAVVGSGGTGNPNAHYDVYMGAILGIVGATNANLFQGVSIHIYPGRDNVYPEPPPTSNVSYSSSICTSGNTPNNSCYFAPWNQVSNLRSTSLRQSSTASWSANLPVYSTEGGFNMIKNLGTDGTIGTVDNTFGIAYMSEWVPLVAAQGAANAMLYLDYDSPCGADNWGCYEWSSSGTHSPWYQAFLATNNWERSATAVGACTTSSITGGTMWSCPLTISGSPAAIVWCAVKNPATCTTSTSFAHQQNLGGTITATGGTLTLSSTAELVY